MYRLLKVGMYCCGFCEMWCLMRVGDYCVGGNEGMSGVTKLDRIRNERIRGTTKVGEIAKKMQGSRVK